MKKPKAAVGMNTKEALELLHNHADLMANSWQLSPEGRAYKLKFNMALERITATCTYSCDRPLTGGVQMTVQEALDCIYNYVDDRSDVHDLSIEDKAKLREIYTDLCKISDFINSQKPFNIGGTKC